MTFGEKLKKTLKTQSITNKDLADFIGVSRGLVTHWCNDVRNPNPKQLEMITNFLKIDASNLIGNEKPIKSVPIISTTSCGCTEHNALQDENLKAYVIDEDWNKDLFAVIACGDSMATEIYDGDICIIDPNTPIQNGDMVYYKIDDESAIKVFFDDEDNYSLEFIPFNTNEQFKRRLIRKDDEVLMNKLTYFKVVQVISSKKNNRSARLKMIGR